MMSETPYRKTSASSCQACAALFFDRRGGRSASAGWIFLPADPAGSSAFRGGTTGSAGWWCRLSAGWISLCQAPWTQRSAHRRRLRSDGIRDYLPDRMPDNGRGTGTLSLAEGIDFPVLRRHWRCFGGEHSPSGEIAIYTGMGFVV